MPFRSRPGRLLLALRVLVLSLLILAVFWALALLLVVFTAWLGGAPLTGSRLLLRCAVCGLIAGLFIAVFHLKKEALRLPFLNRVAFVESLKAILAEFGYKAVTEAEDRLVFRPAFRSFLFGTSIRVQLEGSAAVIVGPKVYLELLRGRLRLQAFLDKSRLEAGERPAALGRLVSSKMACRGTGLSSGGPAVQQGGLLRASCPAGS